MPTLVVVTLKESHYLLTEQDTTARVQLSRSHEDARQNHQQRSLLCQSISEIAMDAVKGRERRAGAFVKTYCEIGELILHGSIRPLSFIKARPDLEGKGIVSNDMIAELEKCWRDQDYCVSLLNILKGSRWVGTLGRTPTGLAYEMVKNFSMAERVPL